MLKILKLSGKMGDDRYDLMLKSFGDFDRLSDIEHHVFCYKFPETKGDYHSLRLYFLEETRNLEDNGIKLVEYLSRKSIRIPLANPNDMFPKFLVPNDRTVYVSVPTRESFVIREKDLSIEERIFVSDLKLIEKLRNSYREEDLPSGRMLDSIKIGEAIFGKSLDRNI